MQDDTLKHKTLKGIFWTIGDFITSKVFMLMIQLVLARLLLPEHFGLIGMILIIIAVSQSLVNSGMQNALIRELYPTQKDFSTVFYFNLFISLLLYILIYFIAPFIATFYEESVLTNLLRVLSLVIIINSLSIIQRTILIREIDFKTQTIINFISTLISGVIAIIFAYFDYGVWSLVVQNVVNQTLQTILLTLYNKWFPSAAFSYRSFKHFFGFGWKLLVSGLINTIYLNVYNVIIGRTYSSASLGFYVQGKMLADVSSQSITIAVQKVTYPVLSKIQEDESKLLNSYRNIIKLSAYITFPFMIGLAAVAENFIPFLLGEKWLETIPFFQILCLASMLYPLHAINLNMLQVKGRSDLFLKLEIIKKLFSTSLIVIVMYLDLGILYLMWTIFISSIVSFFINSYYSEELLNYSSFKQIKDIAKSIVFSVVMGSIVYLLPTILDVVNGAMLLAQVVIGTILYFSLSLFFKSTELEFLLNIIKNKSF